MPLYDFKIPEFVWNRGGKFKGRTTGTTRRCRMEGCLGICLGVRWPDGKLTWPCTKGMKERKNGDYQIV